MHRARPRSLVLLLVSLLFSLWSGLGSPSSAAPGDHVWSRGFTPEAIADITSTGEVVMAGIFYEPVDLGGGLLTPSIPFSGELYVAKFDANGGHLFSFAIGGGQGMSVKEVHEDGSGGVYVLGRVFSGSVDFGGGPLATSNTFFVVRYDAAGNHVFSGLYGDVEAADAQADAQGIVIVGATRSTADFGGGPLTTAGNTDALIARLDTQGNHVFSAIYGDQYGQYGRAVGTDASGAAVAAFQIGSPTDFGGGVLTPAGFGLALVEFDATGAHVRSALYDGDFTSGSPYNVYVDVEDDGDFVVAGELHGAADLGGGTLFTAGGTDVYVALFDTDGVHQFSEHYGSSSYQVVNSVAFTPEGSIVLSGNFVNSLDFGGGPLTAGATSGEIFFSRIAANGDHEFSTQYGSGFAMVSRVSSNGAIVLYASAPPGLDLGGGPLGEFYNFVGVLEGSSTATAAPRAAPRTLGRLGNRPNPFNPRTTVEFELHRPAPVTLTIFDARGRSVVQRELGELGAGMHSIVWEGRDARGKAVASGVYTVMVRTLDEIATHRAVMVE